MGEVYRARDLKLKRDVAIKILPDEFSRDPERLSRFHREAVVLAALNHQNIAAVYDLQQCGATRFLILEFVGGDALADILGKCGALPLDEALNIAKQICDALEAAHEKGIVHRDLKPANIKVAPDGKVKVLDFGLAKLIENAPTGTTLSDSSTLVSIAAKSAGVILGTPAYMAPEQAKGKTVDRRADIWAFGVVLYEMLAGHMLFSGETISETMAAVMMKEPDWNSLPPNLPPRVRELLRRCLVKEPRYRLRDIGDARITIEEVQSGAEVDGDVPQTLARRRPKILVGIAAVLFLAAIFSVALSVLYFNRTAPPEIRLEVNTGTWRKVPDLRRRRHAAALEQERQGNLL